MIYIDSSGEFPWLLVAVIACTTVAGGILGYHAKKELGADYSDKKIPTNQDLVHPEDITEDSFSPDDAESSEPLTTEQRIYNTVLGAALGMAVGGATVAVAGVVATAVVGSSAVFIPALGATGAQTFAIGALAYDVVAMIFAPLIGAEMEPIEVEP